MKITKFNPQIDSLEELEKEVTAANQINKDFFDQDFFDFEVQILYSRQDYNQAIGSSSTPDWMVGSGKNNTVYIFSQKLFSQLSNNTHSNSDFSLILTHEICHLYLKHIFPEFYYPKWLSEGIPCLVANQHLDGKKFLPIAFFEVHDNDGWKKHPAYPQSANFVKYLFETFGKQEMLGFIRNLKKGDYLGFCTLFNQYFKQDFPLLANQWLNSHALNN